MHSSRIEGDSGIELRNEGDKLRGQADMAFQNSVLVAHDGASNVNLDFSMVASRAAILKTVPELKVGETTNIDIRDLDFFTIYNKGFVVQKISWKIRRAKDTIYQQDNLQIPVRVYIIEPTRKYFNDPIRIMVDADGFQLQFSAHLRCIEDYLLPIKIVTGPSLINDTFIIARNTPVATGTPSCFNFSAK